MKHLPRAAILALVACTCVTFGCSIGGDGGDGGDGSSSGGTSGSSGGQCSSGGGGNLGLDKRADMQVSQIGQSLQSNAKVKVAAGGQVAGGVVDTRFDVINAAALADARELLVKAVFLSYTEPATGKDGAKPAFECFIDGADGLKPCTDHPAHSLVPSGGDAICTSAEKVTKLSIVVRFNKPADDVERKAILRFVTEGDDSYDGAKGFQALLTSKVGLPVLTAPSVVDIGTVKLGEPGDAPVTLANTGEADLVIQQIKFALDDPKPFTLEFDGPDGSKIKMKGGETKTFDNLIIKPQQTLQMKAIYTAIDGNGHQDVIELTANDNKQKHLIKMIVNQQVPCLKVIPASAVNFGFVPIGHSGKRPVVLQSCGSDEVVITSLGVKEDKDQVFAVDTSKIDSLGGKSVSKENPLKLGVNEKVTIEVACTPEAAADKIEPGKSQYTAALGMDDNTIQPDKNIALLCNGTATNCPTSVIVSQEGEEIVPQQELHLIGSQSFAGPDQEIAKYQWEVTKAPKGSEDHVFWPNANSPDVLFGSKTPVEDLVGNFQTCNTSSDCGQGQFCQDAPGGQTQKICFTAKVNIAGEYGFKLVVTDKAGNKNCADANQTIVVIPNQAIHIELLWDTPGDQDKFDKGLEAGSDMDLHLSHQTATKSKVCKDPLEMCGNKACKCQQDLDKDGQPDPWFNSPFDTYWFNPAPNWGSSDPSIDDNPSLDLDDTDGWGPENMNLNNPQTNHVYSVGVHYWDAHGFGDSVANVRIYILGKLVADMFSVTMKQCDFWWVKQIDWPSGQLIDYKDSAGKGLANGKISGKYFTQFAATLGAKCSGN